jgi:hypothetical protein
MSIYRGSRSVSGAAIIAIAAALISTGCGGANLARDCEGFSGQYGAPGSSPELLANRVVRVFAITNCDGTGVNASCREVLVDTVRTANNGTFRVDGLTNGDYRVRTFSVDGTQLLETNRVNLPDVCNASPSPSPSPTPTPG